MSRGSGALRRLLSRGGAAEQSVEKTERALDDFLAPTEQLQYQLPGTDVVTHEQDGQTEDIGAASDADSLCVVTDRQLLFVVLLADETDIIDLEYVDLRETAIESSLLKTVLVVETWEQGSYRLRLASDDRLDAAVDYIEQARDCWQFAETLLDELSGQAKIIGSHIEAGRLDEAEQILRDARATLSELRSRVESDGFEAALGHEIEAAEQTLHRTRMRAHHTLAKTLITEATYQTDATDYDGAYERYERATAHLETAISIAEEYDFDEPATARSELETIESRMRNLEVRPMALGRQATERARGTDYPDVRVEAWQEALDHYRDALTAGWGTEFESSTGTETIQFLVEGAVGKLIEARREYATELEAEGDENAEGNRITIARDRYERALDQLEAAHDLAREFRSGDPEDIERQRDLVEWKLDSL
jgi:tetratricopeptide (TPR) repeat protein